MTRAIRLLLGSLAAAVAVPFVAMVRAAPQERANIPAESAPALAALDQRIADADAQSELDKNELGRLGEQLGLQHARVIARGKAFYRLTRAGLLPVGGGFGALVTHAMHVERARRVLASDIGGETRLRGQAA